VERPAQTVHLKAESRRLDLWLLAGVAIAACTIMAGIISTGIGLRYFLQPTGALIVLGGTLGVTLITTPPSSLFHSISRVRHLFSAPSADRGALIEEMVQYARLARRGGTMVFERVAPSSSDDFLRSALLLALDVKDRAELQTALEMELRLRERQGEADAKTFEVAGGFAPTLGIIGTVIGLIDVMRQFSNIQAVGAGIGTAFVSTIYGLVLANLLLLPMAHRIHARVAERFEIQELMAEGVLCLVDGIHPSLIRLRLAAFLREPEPVRSARAGERVPLTTRANG
jgi:chemotaxis protein MotA